jgi:hypothetical protein
MNVEQEENDLGGTSYFVTSDGPPDPEILAMLTSEERAILEDPGAYFRLRASACESESVRQFLSALAASSFRHCEVHEAPIEPSLGATYFAFRLPSKADILISAARLPVPPGVPPWLLPFFENLSATREEGWLVAGGFQYPDERGLPPLSEYAPEPSVDPNEVTVFFDTLHGDYLGFLPSGQCVWYLHETESIEPCADPEATVAEILQAHLTGKVVVAPESDV